MNTKSMQDRNLRKSLKRAARRRLKGVDQALTAEQRRKLRRARADKHIGLRAFLAKEG